MTTPDTAPTRRTRLPIREVVGLVLLLAGAVGMIATLAAVDWRLAAGVGSAAAVTAGLLLTMSEG